MPTHRPRRLRLLVAASGRPPPAHRLHPGRRRRRPRRRRSARSGAPKPTIVLVHGAFADSSGWNAVAGRLLGDGYPVIAFSNPLRGPIADAEYLRQFLTTIEGPVVLVGHSYGGAVITNAATGNPNVKSLVYVAAYAPAEGESVAAANASAAGTPTSPTTWSSGPSPARPAVTPTPTSTRRGSRPVRPGPAEDDRPRHGGDPAPGALAALLTPSGPPAWEDDPELVPGRPAGPHHPAGGRAGDGGAGRLDDRRDRQLARRDDEPPVRGRLAHQGRRSRLIPTRPADGGGGTGRPPQRGGFNKGVGPTMRDVPPPPADVRLGGRVGASVGSSKCLAALAAGVGEALLGRRVR